MQKPAANKNAEMGDRNHALFGFRKVFQFLLDVKTDDLFYSGSRKDINKEGSTPRGKTDSQFVKSVYKLSINWKESYWMYAFLKKDSGVML